MANGNQLVEKATSYEDFKSLKQSIRKNNMDYIPNSMRIIRFMYNQAGTGSEVELSEKGGATIAFPTVDADLYIWAENDHSDAYSLAWSITYASKDGTEYSKTGILHATVGTTVVAVTTDTDYYRTGTLQIITTANTGYVAIGTQNKATIYGIVEQANEKSLHSRYMVPKGHAAWVAYICAVQSIASNLDCYLLITYIPYGDTLQTACKIPIPNNSPLEIQPLLQLKAATDVQFEIKGNLSDNMFDLQILEVEEA